MASEEHSEDSSHLSDALQQETWAEGALPISQSSRDVLDKLMTHLVHTCQWEDVAEIARSVGNEERVWDADGYLVDNSTLLSVAEGNWRLLDKNPTRFRHSLLERILKHFRAQATQNEVVQFVLLYCDEDEVYAFLQKLVAQDLWDAVGYMFQPDFSDAQRRLTLREACKRATCDLIKNKILSDCTEDDLSTQMEEFISEDSWGEAKKLLRCAHNRATMWRIDGQCIDTKLLVLVMNKQWRDIAKQLDQCKADSRLIHIYLEDIERCKSAVQFLEDSEEEEETKDEEVDDCHFLICFRNEGHWLQQMSFRGRVWLRGEKISPHVKYLGHLVVVMYKTYTFDEQKVTILCVIPDCPDKQIDSVLADCEEYFPSCCDDVQQEGTGQAPHVLVIHEIGINPEDEIATLTTLRVTVDQLAGALKQLYTQRLWWALGKVMHQLAHEDMTATEILTHTVDMEDDEMFTKYVLPFCTDEQTNLALTTMICAGQWECVLRLLQLVGKEKRAWTARGKPVDRETIEMAANHPWEDLVSLFQSDTDDSQHRRVMFAACLRGPEHSIIQTIFPDWKPTDDQTDTVLAILLERHLWQAVAEVLNKGVTDSAKRWAVQEIFNSCDQSDIDENSEKYFLPVILPHCDDDQLDSGLKVLVDRHFWQALGVMLKQNLSSHRHLRVVREAALYADESSFISNTLPHCTDDQLDSVLTKLVERRLWKATGQMLKQGVSDSVKQYAVKEACEHCQNNWQVSCLDTCSEIYIINDILPHCAEDQIDSVLTTLVGRRLWRAVGHMLKQGVSDSVKQWAVREACEQCKHSYVSYSNVEKCLTEDILPHCADAQLDYVLTATVEGRLWQCVGEMLGRSVNAPLKEWAVQSAIAWCSDSCFASYILPHCASDRLDSVLETLVSRNAWQAVADVLKRGVSDSYKRWAVLEACARLNRDSDCNVDVTKYDIMDIIPYCIDDQLDSALSILLKRGMTKAARTLVERKVDDAQRKRNVQAACSHAEEEFIVEIVLPLCLYDDTQSALKTLSLRGFFTACLVLLHRFIIDTLHMWAVMKGDTEVKEGAFWDLVKHPCVELVALSPRDWRSVSWSDQQYSLEKILQWKTRLCQVLCEALLSSVKEIWLTGQESKIDDLLPTTEDEAKSMVNVLHAEIKSALGLKANNSDVSNLLPCMQKLCPRFDKCGKKSRYSLSITFIKHLIREYHKRKDWPGITDAVLLVLASVPLVPDVQSVALRVMIRHDFDLISHACLTQVVEQDRRKLFKAAVEQRQWILVKKWADHTLYDDQRLWALEEAFKEKQWEVYLLMADHGLTEIERKRVHDRLAKFATWKVVVKMFERGSQVTEVRELLENRLNPHSAARKLNQKDRVEIMKKIPKLRKLERQVASKARCLNSAKKAKLKWPALFHRIVRCAVNTDLRRSLKEAMDENAWHVVIQLVRLGLDTTQRDALFPAMVSGQQWGVCRALLERGVSVELCLDALPELMERHQWVLVGRVMEYDVADALRRQVMTHALECREGSVVWTCISTLGYCLSVEEREELFLQAFRRGIWRALMPLIEEKDETGIRHRDTAVLEAIEQHEWDVVDHCQRHHADINMKDDDGHTPMHRMARKGDWEAVRELTRRGGDPSLFDDMGVSVLHRAIDARELDATKLLIQFHGDIHSPEQRRLSEGKIMEGVTPLQMMIDEFAGEAIETTLMWCPDQGNVTNERGETCIHTACLTGRPSALFYLIARKVNPLAVTNYGRSALCYAVLCEENPQHIVAKCIELGLSAHQPYITDRARFWKHSEFHPTYEKLLRCPLVLAVIRGLPVVTQMLYESGACSSKQLSWLNTQLQ